MLPFDGWISGQYLQTTAPWSADHVHLGVDIVNDAGTLTRAFSEGEVTVHAIDAQGRPVDGWGDGSFGNAVVLKHVRAGEPTRYTLYAHHRKVLVKTGEYVSKGFPLGEMGMTGMADGVHCHVQGSYNTWFDRDPANSFNPFDIVQEDELTDDQVNAVINDRLAPLIKEVAAIRRDIGGTAADDFDLLKSIQNQQSALVQHEAEKRD